MTAISNLRIRFFRLRSHVTKSIVQSSSMVHVPDHLREGSEDCFLGS